MAGAVNIHKFIGNSRHMEEHFSVMFLIFLFTLLEKKIKIINL